MFLLETIMTELNSFSPNWISLPGDTIVNLLEEYDWSTAQLAEKFGYSNTSVQELINEKASTNQENALLLEKVLGSTAEFWLNRENQYRIQLAKIEKVKV